MLTSSNNLLSLKRSDTSDTVSIDFSIFLSISFIVLERTWIFNELHWNQNIFIILFAVFLKTESTSFNLKLLAWQLEMQYHRTRIFVSSFWISGRETVVISIRCSLPVNPPTTGNSVTPRSDNCCKCILLFLHDIPYNHYISRGISTGHHQVDNISDGHQCKDGVHHRIRIKSNENL